MESNKTLSSEDIQKIIITQPTSLNKTENSSATFKSEATDSKSENVTVKKDCGVKCLDCFNCFCGACVGCIECFSLCLSGC